DRERDEQHQQRIFAQERHARSLLHAPRHDNVEPEPPRHRGAEKSGKRECQRKGRKGAQNTQRKNWKETLSLSLRVGLSLRPFLQFFAIFASTLLFGPNRLCLCGSESAALEAEALPDGGRESRLIEGVEMQPRRAVAQQPLAEPSDDVQAESLDRGGVVAESLQLAADPARNLGAAGIREPGELGEIADRHDARNDRDRNARRPAPLHEAEVG